MFGLTQLELRSATRGLPASFEVISGPRAVVVREVRRALDRGEVRLLDGGLHPMTQTPGHVYARVQRLRSRPPAWRKPVLVTGGSLATLGAFAYAAWALVSALVAVAVPLAVVAGTVVMVQVIRVATRRGGNVEVLQRVTVRR